MKKIIVHNFWLKLLALVLACLLWVYVVGELDRGAPEERIFFDRILPYRLVAKEVPIKVNLVGKPRPGYRIVNENITVKPSNCIIMATKNLVKDINYVTTEPIDISEFTKSVVKEMKIKPISGLLVEQTFSVNVVIPVEKIEEPPPAEVKK